jgi:branched-chain amino acid transport system permease protein
VGAFSIVALENELPDAIAPFVTVIIGVIFVLCVLIFRRGMVGEVAALYRHVVGNRQT